MGRTLVAASLAACINPVVMRVTVDFNFAVVRENINLPLCCVYYFMSLQRNVLNSSIVIMFDIRPFSIEFITD